MSIFRKWYRKLKRIFTRDRSHQAPAPVDTPIEYNSTIQEKLAKMFAACVVVNSSWQERAISIANKINANFGRYNAVEYRTGVPWKVIAAIHSLESGLDFRGVLHNGERIIGRNRVTRYVPKNRGPFETWEDAAVDALMLKKHLFPKKWTIGATLDFLEHYNGLGYRKYHKDVNTPYLWSGTTCYKSGKYVADGKWSSTAKSKQVGAVLILKALDYKGE